MPISDGAVYPSPNAAATALAGGHCKGWAAWRTADGTTLAELRQQLTDPTEATNDERVPDTTEEDR
jgi:hypothetical protein